MPSLNEDILKVLKTIKKVMWGDLDSLQIVFYPRYYEWMDGCGHLFFEYIGINLGRLWKDRGLIFGLVETGCRYLRPARYYDVLEIDTYIKEIGEKTVRLAHDIRHKHSGEIIVEGFEKRICLNVSDISRFKAIDIPPDLRKALAQAC